MNYLSMYDGIMRKIKEHPGLLKLVVSAPLFLSLGAKAVNREDNTPIHSVRDDKNSIVLTEDNFPKKREVRELTKYTPIRERVSKEKDLEEKVSQKNCKCPKPGTYIQLGAYRTEKEAKRLVNNLPQDLPDIFVVREGNYFKVIADYNENKDKIEESGLDFWVRSYACPEDLKRFVEEASLKYNVDPNLVMAMIEKESAGRIYGISEAGASGLMQLMPETAAELGVTNPFDPRQNIYAGTMYLAKMLERFNWDVELALAAYNAGPGNVEKYNGVPPYLETIRYVKMVLEIYNRLNKTG